MPERGNHMFRIHHRLIGSVEPFEYFAKAAEEIIDPGEALVLSGGKLTKCGADVRPEFIAMGGENRHGLVPVIRVLATTVFAVPAQADQSALSEGSKVTLHTDGLQVTATESNGVFTIMRKAKAGAECLGYFA